MTEPMKPLKLAVVGHTNVGKTSLLRTLTRDVGFGEVSHRPSTTRHVEGARLSVDGEALLELYDTPGLEDAIALLDYLERLERPGERLDGPARLARFLEGSEARQRFEQEAKVLRQLLASDAGLYVIDAREPVLAKYRDELEVLASCGKPLLPVLNFVSSAHHREPDWREALARLGLHALVRFDSVAPPEDGERRLYESLALLLESARGQLERLVADQQAQRLARQQSAARLIAELLIDCAACRRSVASDAELEREAISELRNAVRQREQRCVEALLKLYAFRSQDAAASDLPLLDGRWGDDLFNPETLKQLGVRVGGGIAAGAAAGAGVDLLVGGLTLGAAALAGAIVGGTLQTARSYGNRLMGKLKGQRELTVDDGVLRLLALRQRQLLQALNLRGHAAMDSIRIATPQDKSWREGKLPDALNKARAHPQWSSLNPQARLSQAERQELIEQLAEEL
ncbi:MULTISPECIES: GTPase/DUF3482 domain-containing protein [unclassified Pseudomonas]|uniref:GTPase/DUF3482 domain-containing protein n=1 Tax=unclassified Pseudomonas TaxID=196821 RepID=UPI000871657A|nr:MULTISPECIES: GTPase/DUF3482 domain-containing protein [unclassified Pseudomonas]SCW62791.1 small GTP-binding protein domain-containing protein [Pseudomonas sp. NFACC56-3]SFK57456.1 small GTP-binding protein domain-containing protein [Pseudomonas sp. NFACC52]